MPRDKTEVLKPHEMPDSSRTNEPSVELYGIPVIVDMVGSVLVDQTFTEAGDDIQVTNEPEVVPETAKQAYETTYDWEDRLKDKDSIFVASATGLSDEQVVDELVAGDTPEAKAQTICALAAKITDELASNFIANNVGRGVVLILKSVDVLGSQLSEADQTAMLDLKDQILSKLFEVSPNLVLGILSKMVNPASSLAFDDLVSEAQLGLIRVLNGFDLGQNTNFAKYVRARMIGQARDADRKEGYMIRISRSHIRIFNYARNHLASGESKDDIAKFLGLATRQLSDIMSKVKATQITSARQKVSEVTPTDLHGAFRDRTLPGIEEEVLGRLAEIDDINAILDALNQFAPRQRTIMKMRLGLPPYEKPHSLQEIADVFGFDQSRSSQIISEVIKNLRTSLGVDS